MEGDFNKFYFLIFMKNMHMFLHNLESSQAQDQKLGSNAASAQKRRHFYEIIQRSLCLLYIISDYSFCEANLVFVTWDDKMHSSSYFLATYKTKANVAPAVSQPGTGLDKMHLLLLIMMIMSQFNKRFLYGFAMGRTFLFVGRISRPLETKLFVP